MQQPFLAGVINNYIGLFSNLRGKTTSGLVKMTNIRHTWALFLDVSVFIGEIMSEAKY